MTEEVCRDIFAAGATWRTEWAGYSPADRQEFVSICAGFGVMVDGAFDPASPFPPDLVPAPGTVCYGWRDPGTSTAREGERALATGGAGPEAILAGIPTLPRSLLDRLLELPRRLLEALRGLLERLASLFPSRATLWLLLAAAAALLLLYLSRD